MKWIALFIIPILIFAYLADVSGQEITDVPSFRVHVQPGVTEMPGNGDETTSITVTVRDQEGEIIDSYNGTAKIRINAGTAWEYEIPIMGGVGTTLFIAPILDDQNKVFQRSIQLTMKIIQALSSPSTSGILKGPDGMKKMTELAKNVTKNAPAAYGMTSIPGSDPVVKIIAEVEGIKGKASIKITKVPPEAIQGLQPGIYQGRDVTGSTSWELKMESPKEGILTQDGSSDELSFRTRGATKMGFMVVYLYEQKELKMLQNAGAKDFLGLPTAIKSLPGKSFYMVAPPLYLIWKSELAKPKEPGQEEQKPQETASLIPRDNMLPGDGESTTEIVFSLVDKKGIPMRGIPVRFNLATGSEATLLTDSAVTDSRGFARTTFRAQLLKTNKLDDLGTSRVETIYAGYTLSKEKTERTIGQVGVLRCTDAFLTVKKQGFKEDFKQPIIVASPYGSIDGRIVSQIRSLDFGSPEVVPVFDAEVSLTGAIFDKFKNTMKAATNDKGEFVLKLPFKNWPYFWKHKLKEDAFLPISELNKKRRESLAMNLFWFSDEAFKKRSKQNLYRMDRALCVSNRKKASAVDNQYQLLGDLMSILLMTKNLLKDTGNAFLSHGWDCLAVVWEWADSKLKFTKAIEKKLYEKGKDLETMIGLRNELGGGGLKLIIYKKLRYIFGTSGLIDDGSKPNAISQGLRNIFGTKGLPKGLNQTLVIMDKLSDKIFKALQKFLLSTAGSMEAIKKFPSNPAPELFVFPFLRSYFNEVAPEIDKLLNQDPQNVAKVFPVLEPLLPQKAAELREYYMKVATWRLYTEEAKMLKDAIVNASFWVAVGLTAITGPEALATYMKIKGWSEKIDKVYTASGMILETTNFCLLEAECFEFFELTNRSIAGAPVTTKLDLHVIPLAFAEENVPVQLPAPPKIMAISSTEFQLEGQRIPSGEFNRLSDSLQQFQDWEAQYETTLYRLMARKNMASAQYLHQKAVFDDQVEYLLVIAAISGNEPLTPELSSKWNNAVQELIKAGNALDTAATAMHQEGMRLPDLSTYNSPVSTDQLKKLAKTKYTSQSDAGFSLKRIFVAQIILWGAGIIVILALVLYRQRIAHVATAGIPSHKASPKTNAHVASAPQKNAEPAYYLVLSSGKEYLLHQSYYTLGQDGSNSIQITAKGIEPAHAILKFSFEHNLWWIASTDGRPTLWMNNQWGATFWLYPDIPCTIGTIAATLVIK